MTEGNVTELDIREMEARKTYTGKRLTERQFDQSWAIAGVIEREIRAKGQFVSKLADYAYAFSRDEKFDAARGETIIRDQFRARYGRTMNAQRKRLSDRERQLPDVSKSRAMEACRAIGHCISSGDTMPFYRAYDRQALLLSHTLDITESGAKSLMKEIFREKEGKELYEWGKDLEAKFHTPVMEAEMAERESARSKRQSRSRARG